MLHRPGYCHCYYDILFPQKKPVSKAKEQESIMYDEREAFHNTTKNKNIFSTKTSCRVSQTIMDPNTLCFCGIFMMVEILPMVFQK